MDDRVRYPPAQSRRHLPNAGSAVGERDAPGRHQRPCLQSTGPRGHPSIEMRRKRPTCVELPSGDRNQVVKVHPEDSVVPLSSMLCSHPAARPTEGAVSTRLPVTSITSTVTRAGKGLG